ncbi:hypothetical protein BDZ45DRAFT_705194 [Acephala macrosclerotiorum]|nr:hypothetical protein BDZ45DRAFT_705194 [Acephala macrosclerotiorum]
MGITHSTARYVAPLSFLIDFSAQQYGMLSSPNMKDVHDANLSFWSPQPFFIAGFFFPQQLFQLAWLYRLWKLDPKKSEKKRQKVEQMVDFVPYYCVGNLCIAKTDVKYSMDDILEFLSLKTANIFVLINSFTQLYYIFRLPPMNTRSTSSILTHIVSKTFAGIGVLDFLHNGSIFGGCLVYDLVALSVGQSGIRGQEGWGKLLGGFAVRTAAIVGVRSWLR